MDDSQLRRLSHLLADLDRTHGPLNTADDEQEIRRFMTLLGGDPDHQLPSN